MRTMRRVSWLLGMAALVLLILLPVSACAADNYPIEDNGKWAGSVNNVKGIFDADPDFDLDFSSGDKLWGIIPIPDLKMSLTLELGSAIGTWSFRTGNAYLASTSSGNNLTEVASKNANASWKVTVSSSATLIQAQAGGSKLLKHNPSAHRFSCYKNSSTNVDNVVLYRKGSVPTSVEDDPLTAYDAYGSYLTGVERTYEPGVDQLLRSYPDGKLKFAILRAADKEQLVVSGFDPSLAKGDAVTVTVAWRKGLNFLLKEKSFNLKVVKEDGPKVWLGDGSGQGLILKK